MPIQFVNVIRFDSIWTLSYEVIGNKVKIHTFGRNNPVGYEVSHNLPRAIIVQDNKRKIVKIRIEDNSKEYEVINPYHVYGYPRRLKVA